MENAVSYIHALGRFSGAPGLHRMRALCAALGNPQDTLKFVHVAGTNGKGSTACMIAEALQCAGYRTGLYVSPYLIQFHERIRVNGKNISDVALSRLADRVRAAADTLELPDGESIGEFEFITALGFLFFAEEHCDIVVLEAGLGGRCDATNIILSPEAVVITPVALDHMTELGHTITAIAQEKAAIIKKGTAVIPAVGQSMEALTVIARFCSEKQGVWCDYPIEMKVLRCDLDGTGFVYEGQGYSLAMPGRHQIQNALTALHTVQALRDRGWKIDTQAVVHGLARARMPGRLERMRDAPLLLLDGAHNAAGVTALCAFLDENLKMRRLHVVMGMVQDKDFSFCVREMAKRADVFYACAPVAGDRALLAQTLAALAEQQCREVFDCESAEQALSMALTNASPKECVLVCGSLYLVGEIEKNLRGRQKTPE